MRELLVLGSGCSRCDELERNARAAVEQIGGDWQVEKVSDLKTIAGLGVMMTPALVVDGVVASAGKVLSTREIVDLLL